MQFILGAMPWEMGAGITLANAASSPGSIGSPAPSPAIRRSAVSSCCMARQGCGARADYFVSVFRGTPILPWDFTALGTAAAVAGRLPVCADLADGRSHGDGGSPDLGAAPSDKRRGLPTQPPQPACPAGRSAAGRAVPVPRASASMSGRFRSRGRCMGPDRGLPQRRSGGCVSAQYGIYAGDAPRRMPRQSGPLIVEGADKAPPAAVDVERPNIIAVMNESWADFASFGHSPSVRA